MMLFLTIALTSCKRKDPSVYDIKSPCAASGNINTNGLEPCVKRTPIGNKIL